MPISAEDFKAKEAQLVRQMASKLRQDIAKFDHLCKQGPPRTFVEFCKTRNHHNDIQALIYTIEDRVPGVIHLLPPTVNAWTIQAKMKALTLFIEVAREFMRNPPLTLTGSLTARDVLSMEQKNFTEAHAFFNNILMEQALDDQTADRLVRTLTMIEETNAIIDTLLSRSKNYLDEFE